MKISTFDLSIVIVFSRRLTGYNYRLLLGKLALYVNGWRDIANRERVNEAMLERRPCWPI